MAPSDLHQAVEAAFNRRDVEALVALYEQDAWLFGSVVGEDEISATSAEVARRQGDGTWKYLIDNPDSAGVLAG